MITDGATLPLFFRRWIVRNYSDEVISLIDRGGHFHDELAVKYPNTATHNRKRFIKLLRRYKIPNELVLLINFGLFVYDASPNFLKKILKKSTK